MSGPDIFLSYARTDRAVARLFADSFAEEGFTVWWDASLHSGETFDEVIERNLRDAKAVVVLWSPRSVASRWVRAEATQADRRNKLVPAIIEACDRPIIFELTHAAELAGWEGDTSDIRWRTFMEDLRHLIDRVSNEAQAAAAAASEPAAPVRKPLRPGNDEVIVSHKAPERSAPPAQPVAFARPVERADEALEIHYLEIDDPELGDATFDLDATSVKIGRSPPADIVVAHKSVSREHCVIGMANDEVLVSDLNSTNGTFIDGERVTRGTILPVGSELRLGQVTLRHAVRPGGDWDSQAGAGAGHHPPRIAAA